MPLPNRPLRTSTTNDDGGFHLNSQNLQEASAPMADAKEVLVQKLQGALHAIRLDRDQEHRQRDMALERLRSVKAAMDSARDSLDEEKARYVKTCAESQDRQEEVHALQEEIEVLKQKVRGGDSQVLFIVTNFLGYVLLGYA